MKTRRHFLQSSTALIALPALESLGFRRFASAAAPATPPKRLLFLGFISLFKGVHRMPIGAVLRPRVPVGPLEGGAQEGVR